MAFEMSRTTHLTHDLPACHAGGRGFEPQWETLGGGGLPTFALSRRQVGRFRQIILNHQARRANRFFEFSARRVKSSNALRRGTSREQHAQARGR
jgi:hypothetical protein